MQAERAASTLQSTLRAWQTVRHLRSRQLIDRVTRRVLAPRFKPCPPCALRQARGHWVPPLLKRPAYVSDAQVELLHETRSIAGADAWNAPDASQLWLFHLHYFDDLGAACGEGRRAWQQALVRRWIAENPPVAGAGWEPYPISLRAVNWIKWQFGGSALDAVALASLADQLAWLHRRIEHHLLGNHLFENAKALLFAGSFLEGAEPERWRSTGRELLRRELREQILRDGGHFELSPMYHATILEDVLDLVNLGRAYGERADEDLLLDVTRRMLGWLEQMTHPDGGIALFNDAALDHAPTFAELDAYAARLEIESARPRRVRVVSLPDSGYVRVSSAPFDAFLDVASVGPDYLPAHAHADTLSFELSIRGARVVVDSGTSTYAAGPERLRQRATAAHNTITVDGTSSSDVWSAFRVGRRARIVARDVAESGDAVIVTAAHDGFAHQVPGALHRRRWSFADSLLTIDDEVSGAGEHEIAWSLHLHPEIDVEIRRSSAFALRRDGAALAEIATGEGLVWSVEDTTYHPGFGRALPARRIVGRGRVALPFVLHVTLRVS